MNWILEHVTLPYIITLVVGMLLGVGIGYLVDYVRVRRGKPVERQSALNTIAAVVIILTMIWIMISTNQARNCAITLNVAVARDQAISKMERDAFAKAILASQAVPQEIQNLPQNDPARKAVMDPIVNEYLATTAKAAELRKENQANQDAAQRACGRK